MKGMLLGGVRVLSLCHYLQGPAAAQYLADMGADVVKVEPMAGAYERHWSGARVFVGEVSGFYLCANRNKLSIAIDLKSARGRDTFLRLAAKADVVMENFRPGTAERLGIGYEALRAVKPDIIFASASGFGQDGPYAELPGQDLLIQARTGLVAATAGQRGDVLPAAAGCAAVDQHGAALFAMGIAAALYRKATSGQGTRVESSLFNAGIDLQQESIVNYLNGAKTPAVFDRDPHLATWFHEAPYGIYRTADGRHIAMSLNALPKLRAALQAAGSTAFDPDEAPSDAYRDRDRIAVAVAAALGEVTFAQADEAFAAAGIWYAPVQNYSDLVADPQAIHNRVFETIRVSGQDAVVINHPNRYDGRVPPVRRVAERVGQDTREVLAGYGFADSEIGALRAAGIVA
jgi:crotonobetainyl-CoA:carnitine CoA-transferase CaiB-like acyl-CoA transferase